MLILSLPRIDRTTYMEIFCLYFFAIRFYDVISRREYCYNIGLRKCEIVHLFLYYYIYTSTNITFFIYFFLLWYLYGIIKFRKFWKKKSFSNILQDDCGREDRFAVTGDARNGAWRHVCLLSTIMPLPLQDARSPDYLHLPFVALITIALFMNTFSLYFCVIFKNRNWFNYYYKSCWFRLLKSKFK